MQFLGFLFFFLLVEVENKRKREKRRQLMEQCKTIFQAMAIPNVKDIELTLIPKLMVCECNWCYMYHIYTHQRKIALCTVMQNLMMYTERVIQSRVHPGDSYIPIVGVGVCWSKVQSPTYSCKQQQKITPRMKRNQRTISMGRGKEQVPVTAVRFK